VQGRDRVDGIFIEALISDDFSEEISHNLRARLNDLALILRVCDIFGHALFVLSAMPTDMNSQITIRFFEFKKLDEISIRFVRGIVGLYFIFLPDLTIEYPFRPCKLIYIGMSESKQNSIGNRLRDHASGQSGNPGLTNYIKTKDAEFTYLTFDLLSVLQIPTVGELEGAFLRAFLASFGCYPICNNQSGIEIRGEELPPQFDIDWHTFV
jgi:hypothetical protein